MQVEHYIYNFLSLLRCLVEYSLLKNTWSFNNISFKKFDFYISGVEKSIKLNFKKFCLILLNLEFIVPGLWDLKFCYVFDKKIHKKKIFFKFITFLLNYKLFFLFLFNFRFLKNTGFNENTILHFKKKTIKNNNKQIFLLNKIMFIFKLRFINIFFIQININKNNKLPFKYKYFFFFL